MPDNKLNKQGPDTLGMDVDEMRRLGYKVVDHVIEHFTGRQSDAAIVTGTRAELVSLLSQDLPVSGGNPDEAIDLLAKHILKYQQHGDHPRYFARVPGPSSFAAVLGDWLATGFNTITTSWTGSSGPSAVELLVCEWLSQLLDLPEHTEGIISSGGSHANLIALAAANRCCGPGIAYLTDQTHSSLMRNLAILGFQESNIRILTSEANYTMPLDKLRDAIRHDKNSGNKPVMVLATAGTTNTGAVDPLNEIADICQENNLWFHIDGAYGGPAYLSKKGKKILGGLNRCDSIVIDPHKWLFQPYDIGMTLVTRTGVLEQTYSMDPEYLKDTTAQEDEINFRDRGLELTRRGRAIKLWLSLQVYGVNKIHQAISHAIELAEFAEAYLLEDPDTWELISPAQIGILCFSLRGEAAKEHADRVKKLSASGYACVSSSNLHGKSVLRLCIINNLTTEQDIVGTLDRLSGKIKI